MKVERHDFTKIKSHLWHLSIIPNAYKYELLNKISMQFWTSWLFLYFYMIYSIDLSLGVLLADATSTAQVFFLFFFYIFCLSQIEDVRVFVKSNFCINNNHRKLVRVFVESNFCININHRKLRSLIGSF